MASHLEKLTAIGLAVGLAAAAARAQPSPDDLATQIEQLRQGQEEIRRQLQEIRRLLEQRQAPTRPAAPEVAGERFDLGENPVRGADTARLTLVEFTDYQ